MSASKVRIALVAAAGETRASLATYLSNAGFDVHACDELSLPSAFGALVVLHDASGDVLVTETRLLIKSSRGRRVVIVTSKPSALKELRVAHSAQLYVLPAPVFGWDLVDALRAREPPKPRCA